MTWYKYSKLKPVYEHGRSILVRFESNPLDIYGPFPINFNDGYAYGDLKKMWWSYYPIQELSLYQKIPTDKVKIGQFIWWKAVRIDNSWDCPGVIEKIDHDEIHIRTFDDMNITVIGNLTKDKSLVNEFHIPSNSEVAFFLKHKILTLEINKLEAMKKVYSVEEEISHVKQILEKL